jgi:hypothetical protein
VAGKKVEIFLGALLLAVPTSIGVGLSLYFSRNQSPWIKVVAVIVGGSCGIMALFAVLARGKTSRKRPKTVQTRTNRIGTPVRQTSSQTQRPTRTRSPEGYFAIEPDPEIKNLTINRVGIMTQTKDYLELVKDLPHGLLVARSKLREDGEDWAAIVVKTADGKCRIAGGYNSDQFGLQSYQDFTGLESAFSKTR